MDITFDFDYYKSIIDYMDTSTTYIDETLQDFVNNYLESRKKTIMPVPVFSSSVEEMQIGGGLKIIPENNTWTALTDIKMKLFNNEIECSYLHIKDNTVILTDSTDKLIAELSKTFAQLSQVNEFEFTYSDTVSSSDFEDSQIPSFEWFANNFYTINDKTVKFKIYSQDLNGLNDTDVVNIEIGNSLSSANKQNKNISINVSKNINNNIFSVSETSFSLLDTNIVIEFSNIKTFSLEGLNSIITDSAISNEVILKNLSNLKQLTVIDSTELNSVISYPVFLAKMGAYKPTKQEMLKIDTDAKNFLTKNDTFVGKYMDYFYRLILSIDSFESLFEKMVQDGNVVFKDSEWNRYSKQFDGYSSDSVPTPIYKTITTKVSSNIFDYIKDLLSNSEGAHGESTLNDYLKDTGLTEFNVEKTYTELFIYIITSRRFNKYCNDIFYSFVEPVPGIPATLANINLLVVLFNHVNAEVLVSNSEFLNILNNKVSFLDDDEYSFTSPICVNNELPCKAININSGINIAAEKTYLF